MLGFFIPFLHVPTLPVKQDIRKCVWMGRYCWTCLMVCIFLYSLRKESRCKRSLCHLYALSPPFQLQTSWQICTEFAIDIMPLKLPEYLQFPTFTRGSSRLNCQFAVWQFPHLLCPVQTIRCHHSPASLWSTIHFPIFYHYYICLVIVSLV
jgi:hypothetical protein